MYTNLQKSNKINPTLTNFEKKSHSGHTVVKLVDPRHVSSNIVNLTVFPVYRDETFIVLNFPQSTVIWCDLSRGSGETLTTRGNLEIESYGHQNEKQQD